MFKSIFRAFKSEEKEIKVGDAEKLGHVVPDQTRCVQCGVCGYNCPVGIQVRDYAHRGLPVDDPRCITCGNCIQVCPRGTLRWETQAHTVLVNTFGVDASLEKGS